MLDSERSASAAKPSRRSDGAETHAAILEIAMRLASVEGLGSLTIGRLAQELGISKSGVYAHFGSKTRLHQETVDEARRIFAREVLEPGLAAPEGLDRLESLCEAFLSYVERSVFPGGCFFAQLLAEFDAPSGRVHDEVLSDQQGWLGLLEQLVEAAVRLGELDGRVDAGQLAFELHAAMDMANYLTTLHRDPSFIDRGRTAIRAAISGAATDPGARAGESPDVPLKPGG